jgi:large subunit ribosomal protein L9
MKVILLQDVPKIGRKFDAVDVADGYAMNFIFPQKLGERATPKKLADLALRKENARVAEEARMVDLKEKLESLKESTLTITGKADDQGHLYKKINAQDIAKALKDEYDIHVHKESVLLDEPIHTTGDTQVQIETAGIKAILTIQVVAE